MYEVINLVPKNLIRKPLFVYQTKFAEGYKKKLYSKFDLPV